jgi:Transcriptional regulatory protein, C terminal
MGSESRTVYRFDGFTLDLIRGVLRSPDGSEVALRPKSFDMLRFMVTHAGRLMDRDELMQAVWPDVIVTDDSITQCIMDVRRGWEIKRNACCERCRAAATCSMLPSRARVLTSAADHRLSGRTPMVLPRHCRRRRRTDP